MCPNNPSTSFSLKHAARAIVADPHCHDASTWLVATNTLKESNEVRGAADGPDAMHLDGGVNTTGLPQQILSLQHNAVTDTLECHRTWVHQHGLWQLVPSPHVQDILVTVHDGGLLWGGLRRTVGGLRSTVKLVDHVCPMYQEAFTTALQQRLLGASPAKGAHIHTCPLHSTTTGGSNQVQMWRMGDGVLVSLNKVRTQQDATPTCASWDPLAPNALVVADTSATVSVFAMDEPTQTEVRCNGFYRVAGTSSLMCQRRPPLTWPHCYQHRQPAV